MSAKTYLVVAACLGLAAVAGGCRAHARATVGGEGGGAPPPPPRHVHEAPPPAAPAWNPAGWELLGETWVEGKTDVDTIHIGKKEGRFTNLMVVVENSDLEMVDMTIEFNNGQKVTPDVRQYFRENTRTRAIDLPGEKRFIKNVTFHYRNLPGGGRARVALYGKLAADQGPAHGGGGGGGAPVVKANFDATGWVLLGEQTVQGKRDFDEIKVGKQEGKFTKLMVVVEDSDLEMKDMEITFGNGQKEKPAVKHFFRESDRTRAIDLPGNKRFIKNIKFWYSNLPGGGRARVAVYGKAG
jgi:hypothetical protein